MNGDARRRGRRDNGLDAANYVPLADVDPRIGEHLLDVLWAVGLPAFLEPASDVDPTRAIRVPSPPTDRLYVDSARRAEAHSIIDAALPNTPGRLFPKPEPTAPGRDDGPPLGLEEEAAWRELVANFDGAQPPEADSTADTSAAARLARGERIHQLPLPGDLPSLPEDADEHFVPPPPPPIPRLSKETVGALALIALGAVLLIVPNVLYLAGQLPFALGVLAILGGVGLLVWRMREDHDGDGPDDGAIV